MVSQNADVQRDTLQSKFDRIIPREWIKKSYQHSGVYKSMDLVVPNDIYGEIRIKITWKTYDSSVNSFESASVDQLVLDEEPPADIYAALMARLLDASSWGNGWFKCAMTPTKGEGWTTHDIWDKWVEGKLDKNEYFVVQMSTYENAHNLGGIAGVKRFESTIPEHERSARIYGLPFAREGYVVDKYVDELYPKGNLLEPFKPDWADFTPWESIDHGYSNYTSVGFYAVHRKGYKVKYDEIYVKEHTIPVIKGMIYHKRKFYGYKYPLMTLIDPSTKKRESTGTSPKDQYVDDSKDNVWIGEGVEPTENHLMHLSDQLAAGTIDQATFEIEKRRFLNRDGYIRYSVPVVDAMNAREEGWEILNHALCYDKIYKRPDLLITKNCIDTRRELKRLKNKRMKDGSLAKGNRKSGDDHAADETRYFVCANPYFEEDFSGIGGDGDIMHVKQ